METFIDRIWAKKLVFLGTFFLVFTVSYLILVALDFLPEEPLNEDSSPKEEVLENESLTAMEDGSVSEAIDNAVADEISSVENPEFPTQVVIEKLDKTISVANPTSRTIADLDEALLDGLVRHPDSANLTQEGNVFILGHSSYLPNVFNKNFQALNGIQDLEWGDVIKVYSEDSVFEYRVEKVYRANAQDLTIPIAGEGHRLTLATCNSFGSVDDRYIVEAKQIEVIKL